jgi:hypothetical protein
MKTWFLLMLLVSPLAQAQDEAQTRPAGIPQEQPAGQTQQEDEASETETDDEENAEPLDGDSPDDFVPSQQISEDLSVSFPVDI